MLRQPLLYLSLYFISRRPDYYRRLQEVREYGTWEARLEFFLDGVAETADQAFETANRIARLFDDDRERIVRESERTGSVLQIHWRVRSITGALITVFVESGIIVRLNYPVQGDRRCRMTEHKHETHPEIVKRLKRAEGHLKSVIAMIESGRPCLDIAQQLHAVEKAIAQAKRTLIQDHLDHCLEETVGALPRERRQSIDEFKLITKYL